KRNILTIPNVNDASVHVVTIPNVNDASVHVVSSSGMSMYSASTSERPLYTSG
ncbi:9165_t:CDS:1, partial [Cetraspora pellucida]